MNYYKIDHISNSKLGELSDSVNAHEKPLHIQSVYNFGNLVDAMITEPELVDWLGQSCYIESEERKIEFEEEEWYRAMAMKDAFFADSFCVRFHRMMKTQYIYLRRKFEFRYMGHVATMPVKCKFDFINKQLRISGDLKGLSITNELAFHTAIDHFNYDRQAAFYMDVAGCIDSHTIIGISKSSPHKIFKKTVNKGDYNYLRGREKYNRLGVLYKQLV